MFQKRNIWAAVGLAMPLALLGCLKSNQDATSLNSPNDGIKSVTGLDASHGGARVVLPEIDPATLNKQGLDTTKVDTLPKAWFELTISGPNMADMFFQYPLDKKGGHTFEIKAIPAGKKRTFHGRLLNRDWQMTHEGTTVAEIRAGEFADIHLFLAKASGSANVCVVIEGQKLPACALDTLPPPPPPPLDTNLISHCWYVGSDSVTGQLYLWDDWVNGSRGVLVTLTGTRLPITNWFQDGDTLSAIVVRASMDKKWQLNGVIQNGSLWIGSGVGEPMESPFSFYGKPIPCAEDTIIVPPKDTVPPPIDTVLPPKDTLKAGRIPSPTSSAGETTLCFEMRLDYGGGCEMAGYAKLNFFAGQITKGNITVADSPSRTYTQILGSYDQKSIHIESVLPGFGVPVADSMMYDGAISNDRTMAKGDYIRLPSEKQGIWTMSSVVCGAWTPKYPDSACSVKK